jgi:Cupin
MAGHDEKKNPFKLRAFTGCLGQFIHFAVAEVADKRAGSESVLTKLSELMFVDVVRRYIVTLPQQDTGWLAGLRDPALPHPTARIQTAVLLRGQDHRHCSRIFPRHND